MGRRAFGSNLTDDKLTGADVRHLHLHRERIERIGDDDQRDAGKRRRHLYCPAERWRLDYDYGFVGREPEYTDADLIWVNPDYEGR